MITGRFRETEFVGKVVPKLEFRAERLKKSVVSTGALIA
jgi:hypothetical protein